jgi:hypothetical protein
MIENRKAIKILHYLNTDIENLTQWCDKQTRAVSLRWKINEK